MSDSNDELLALAGLWNTTTQTIHDLDKAVRAGDYDGEEDMMNRLLKSRDEFAEAILKKPTTTLPALKIKADVVAEICRCEEDFENIEDRAIRSLIESVRELDHVEAKRRSH